MEKDSFILYTEQKEIINKLSDEQAGKLLKAIYEYTSNGEIPDLDLTLDIVFTQIRQTLDRNTNKWNQIKQRRSEAGKLGAKTKKQNEAKEANANFVKNEIAKEANANFVKDEKANQAVNVNDNVNVNVNDNVNDTAVVVNNKLANITKYYEANIGLVVPATATDLIEISEKHDEKLVFKAIDIACRKNKRNMAYILGILRDWERKGYKSIADIQDENKTNDLEKRVKEALYG